MTTPRTIAEMQNRPTAYEVAINGKVVAYVQKKTRAALLNIAAAHGKALAAMMTEAQLDADWHYAKGVLTLGGNGPKVHFTGRTERDAAIAA